MTETEAERLMEHHGITATQKVEYYYQGFRYGNLADAVNYAALTTGRANELAARGSNEKPTTHQR